MKSLRKNSIQRKCTGLLARVLTVVLFLVVSSLSYGGVLLIDKETLLLNGTLNDRFFAPASVITLSARGEDYSYAGKPYKYAVFALYRVLPDDRKELVGKFLGQIISKPMFKVETRFALPHGETEYQLFYHTTPFFSSSPMVDAMYGGFLKSQESQQVDAFYRDPSNYPYTELLTVLSAGAAPARPDVFVYMQGFQRIQDEIRQRKPPTFRWYVGSETSSQARNVRFTYRLSPLEDEWSIPSSAKEVTYQYLPPGNYTFEVRALYVKEGEQASSAVADYSFTVKKHIYSIAKGDKQKIAENVISPELRERLLTQKSRALLVGVSQYESGSGFTQLPFVRKDLVRLANALVQKKFEVTVLTPDNAVVFALEKIVDPSFVKVEHREPTKAVVLDALSDLRKASFPGDRVILYFSGHGTAEGGLGYIAPQDCRQDNRSETCISLDAVKDWIDKMMTVRDVKHLLVILDSCQSGLGVLSKASSDVDVATLSRYSSAHMMTAGLVDQEAFVDTDQNMSIFTSFLIKGLNEADYTKDKAITLSELTLFVQKKVSRYVFEKYQKEQTPVMGKVKGAGEMVFVVD